MIEAAQKLADGELTPETAPTTLELLLSGSPYLGYTYSYPHKTAYRKLSAPIALSRLWQNEPQDQLFLYLHVPLCECRCGYCNLFSKANPQSELRRRFVETIERQARVVSASALGSKAHFSRVAIGGGTPTLLDVEQLERLLSLPERVFGASIAELPTSLETSPDTASRERIELARSFGIDRISIGVQSFFDAELEALGRPQNVRSAEAALERICSIGVPTLNIDLIYGTPGQTVQSFLTSIKSALRYQPRELYLYPLYVRPLTGLGRRRARTHPSLARDQRALLLRAGRDFLLAAGYEQRSLRLFRRQERAHSPQDLPTYRCQEDGMIGLGCGARSYTRALHYSDDWAVSREGVSAILGRWLNRSDSDFASAHYGVALDDEEQKRRFVIKSLLHADGLQLTRYRDAFGSEPMVDFAELTELLNAELLAERDGSLQPTCQGLEWSDAIGPWLYSSAVRQLMQSYALR
jgi:oxygen-independent coproporphyrinogen-3 oxidase